MTRPAVRGRRRAAGLVAALGLVVGLSAGCESGGRNEAPGDAADSRTARRIAEALDRVEDGALTPTPREGLAAAIVIDTSGSMDRMARDSSGRSKIAVARESAIDLVNQFARYAADHPDEPVLLGIYEFSSRDGRPDTRAVVAMSAPDRDRGERAIRAMTADGGTPIGDAMIQANRALDATGLSRRHLLVVTDGENTDGFDPADVAAAINRRPIETRPSLYFVAFDIAASRFDMVRDAGGLVLGAATGKELGETLDALLRGKILIEK